MMGLIWLGYNFGRWRSLLVLVCWEARAVERSILGGNIGSSRTGNSFKIQDGTLSKENHQQRVAIMNHMMNNHSKND